MHPDAADHRMDGRMQLLLKNHKKKAANGPCKKSTTGTRKGKNATAGTRKRKKSTAGTRKTIYNPRKKGAESY